MGVSVWQAKVTETYQINGKYLKNFKNVNSFIQNK